MGFLDSIDSLSDKIADVGEKAYQKGKDFADTQSANMEIKDEERRIEHLYAEIGRNFVAAHSAEAETEFGSQVSQIRQAEKHIEELQDRIREIKNA